MAGGRLLDATEVQNGSGVFEEQAVGEVSERTGRGKHTTRHVSLLELPSEIRRKLNEATCAFADCLHVGEPDCAVGGDWERYAHYLHLLEEVKKREELEMKTFGTKRESEMRYKVRASGIKQAEPRLALKKHRRVSRNKGKQDVAWEVAEEVDRVSLGEE